MSRIQGMWQNIHTSYTSNLLHKEEWPKRIENSTFSRGTSRQVGKLYVSSVADFMM